MTTAHDHQRAGRLMVDARTQALALIRQRKHPVSSIALRSFVFVEEAARLWPKEYSAAEKQRVLARFHATAAQLAVTEAD